MWSAGRRGSGFLLVTGLAGDDPGSDFGFDPNAVPQPTQPAGQPKRAPQERGPGQVLHHTKAAPLAPLPGQTTGRCDA